MMGIGRVPTTTTTTTTALCKEVTLFRRAKTVATAAVAGGLTEQLSGHAVAQQAAAHRRVDHAEDGHRQGEGDGEDEAGVDLPLHRLGQPPLAAGVVGDARLEDEAARLAHPDLRQADGDAEDPDDKHYQRPVRLEPGDGPLQRVHDGKVPAENRYKVCY